jgi:hypothetical protein
MKVKKLTDGLSAESAAWVKSVLQNWVLEKHHIRLLLLAASHWDAAAAARQVIQRDGAVYLDRFGCPKPRPEVAIFRDSSVVFSRLLRELALDVEQLESPRPTAFIGKGKK